MIRKPFRPVALLQLSKIDGIGCFQERECEARSMARVLLTVLVQQRANVVALTDCYYAVRKSNGRSQVGRV